MLEWAVSFLEGKEIISAYRGKPTEKVFDERTFHSALFCRRLEEYSRVVLCDDNRG